MSQAISSHSSSSPFSASRFSTDLSLIIPVYSEVESLREIYDRVQAAVLPEESFEILFVNDGNINNAVYRTLEDMKKLPGLRVIHLSRNFGQHVAITAGMANASGAYVAVMDADLQYHPEDVVDMYRNARRQGKPAMLSTIQHRQHVWIKKQLSHAFYTLMGYLGFPYRTDLGSVFVINDHVKKGLLAMHDRHRMTIPMIFWLYGDIAYQNVEHYPRRHGKSGYSFRKITSHAINGVVGYSATPLYISLLLGAISAASAIFISIFYLVRYFLFQEKFLSGWLSTLLILLVSFSSVFICLGIIGVYLGKIYETINKRPLYYIQQDPQYPNCELFEGPVES